ncbi:MAG TPA: 30S ribosomal protein S1 [Planctomycetia bacterium]|nr:30S ribosomal protein S1 [Planctomycetia bacterium]
MVNRSLLREVHVTDAELDAEVKRAFGDQNPDTLAEIYGDEKQSFKVNDIVSGRIKKIMGDDVIVDIGFKSEGVVSRREWDFDPMNPGANMPQIGETIEVLLENVESEGQILMLSKRKAERIRGWERVIRERKEGDVVAGKVERKIKGGLLVNIGVNVFLPASQVDIRRPHDIGEYVGKTIDCLVLKIDQDRRNIVVSRRELLERKRSEAKEKLLAEIQVKQIRKGVVKNLADFGAFVDLGGIDGLLHITDMSWGRIGHPSEIVKIDQEIEVQVLNVDREREKIALGLKQMQPSPWDKVPGKYPVGTKIKGEVVNVMNYGAFVKLEEGIEGLVHISEMSWTKRINHPSEVVHVGDQIEVVVLQINQDRQEISLGIKQTEPNPWDDVAKKYPPGMLVKGVVRNLTNYGAFVEIEEGIDGLLHVSDISWVRKVTHPQEVLQKNQTVECQVLTVDQERKRIALGIKQLKPDPWSTDIPNRYKSGQAASGKVTKITNFGVFVELEEGLEGLLHVSELPDGKSEEQVKVGDTIECKVLRVDVEERKIGLSRKGGPDVVDEKSGAASKSKPAKELKGGVGSGGGLLIEKPAAKEPDAAE